MVNSGYRCKKKQQQLREQGYETAVGVSQHELGNAADLACSPMGMINLKAAANLEFSALGEAKTFIHVDTRKDKMRRWTYGQ